MKPQHSPTPLKAFQEEIEFCLKCGIGLDPSDLKKWLPKIRSACNAHEAGKELAHFARMFLTSMADKEIKSDPAANKAQKALNEWDAALKLAGTQQ